MIQATLDTLSHYASFFFHREEKLMDAFNYPGLEFHRAEHRNLLQKIAKQRIAAKRKASVKSAKKLFDELSSWFCHHALLQDIAFAPYIDDTEKAERIAREGTAECLLDLTVEHKESAACRSSHVEVEVEAAVARVL